MDESGSVSKADFEQQQNFVKALAGHFQFGPSASQFGVITFSTNAKLDITLNRYGDAASFQKGVNTISHEGILYEITCIYCHLSFISNLALSQA